MMRFTCVMGIGISMVLAGSARNDEIAATGPETEKRFPSIQVPDGFQATLFACDPLIEYPSVISIGPELGSLFVAHDYLTGLGVEIVRRDEIRLIRDTDGDGYADQSTLYADGFHSIQGLAWHDGNVYVMHAPLLTSLIDADGDGVADQRRDLLDGLGLPPEENSNRLHCANGVVAGHDGWLYLALGDRGCDVKRPEGDRLVFREGGILRCRPDGRDLHVYSHGLRNIYDVALDEELNVFVRDNENDGGDYMIRVCHCFHGSDHGYPYLYYERPDEALRPLADLGRGSSAGGLTYLEAAFPSKYRGSLFFCEWGRAVVYYQRQRAGSSFRPMHEADFAAGAAGDPYGFKPTDLVVDWDGSLVISDWGDGQRPKRGRGRIYRVSPTKHVQRHTNPAALVHDAPLDELTASLNSDRYYLRAAAQRALVKHGPAGLDAIHKAIQAGQVNPLGRLHYVWILAHVLGVDAIDPLFALAEKDPDARVQAQSVRALADLTDPVLRSHRLDAGPGDARVCRRLAGIGTQADPRVRLAVMIALGRLRWADSPLWLKQHWADSDPALAHAAMVMLRRSDNWPAVLNLLDGGRGAREPEPDEQTTLRTLALRAVAEQAREPVVDGLLRRLKQEPAAVRRREYLDLLARVHRKPAEWTYWGFRPAPRPADSVSWKRSDQIASTFNHALCDGDASVRPFAVQRMLREDIPIRDEALTEWLDQETNADAVAAILAALANRPAAAVRSRLESVIRSESHAEHNRLAALNLLVRGLDKHSEGRLLELARSLEDGTVRASAFLALGDRPGHKSADLFLAGLESADSNVRAAAAAALVKRPAEAVASRVVLLLQDRDIRVRRAAAALAGQLKVQDAAEQLLVAAQHADRQLRSASLYSLATLREPGAVSLALGACDDPETQLAALACLKALGNPRHLQIILTTATQSRSIDVLAASIETLKSWQERSAHHSEDWHDLERAVSVIQGNSGIPVAWRVHSIDSPEAAAKLAANAAIRQAAESDPTIGWRQQLIVNAGSYLQLSSGDDAKSRSVHLAAANLFVSESQPVEFLAAADGILQVWLNGREVWRRKHAARYQPGSDQFDGDLAQGVNRLLVQVTGDARSLRLQIRFRRKRTQADHEHLTRLALSQRGNSKRGREIFLDAEKTLCLKCHRIGDKGGRIGPDLAGIGRRFSRIHLIEAVLEPSRTVAPSYESVLVLLADGNLFAGVKVAETDTALTLGDNQGQTRELSKLEIEAIKPQQQSTMPDGLEKRLTDREFVDLISFLESQKQTAQHFP